VRELGQLAFHFVTIWNLYEMVAPSSKESMNEYVASIFSEHSLHRFDHEMLMEVPLMNVERQFLEDVGVPKDELLGWSFDPVVYGLRPLSHIANERRMSGFEGLHQLALAGGQDVLASVNLEQSHIVVSIDLHKEECQRFINSSLVAFVACLAAYLKCCHECGCRENDNASVVASFVATIVSIDDKCLDDPENWWSLIVEQMETGLL
jgi:hypothetical protein